MRPVNTGRAAPVAVANQSSPGALTSTSGSQEPPAGGLQGPQGPARKAWGAAWTPAGRRSAARRALRSRRRFALEVVYFLRWAPVLPCDSTPEDAPFKSLAPPGHDLRERRCEEGEVESVLSWGP